MWAFNLLVTQAADGRFQRLLTELCRYGDFRKTAFLGVILGQVIDPLDFLETVRVRHETELRDLGRVVPLEHCFTFTAETFLEQVRDALVPYAERLNGQRFYVRLERRGFKGRIISPEAERSLDRFLLERVEGAGGHAEVAFDDPDTVLSVETVGERCGIGPLSRELMLRYEFARVP